MLMCYCDLFGFTFVFMWVPVIISLFNELTAKRACKLNLNFGLGVRVYTLTRVNGVS